MEESQKKSLEVNILGQNIRIKHEDEQYIRDLEEYVNEKLDDVDKQQNITSLQKAVRILMVMADEHFTLLKEKENDRKSVDDRAKRLIEFIDQKATLDVFNGLET